MRRPLQPLLFVLVLLLAGATVGAAQEDRRYWIESFDVTLEVRADGVLEVEERLEFGFEGSFNGIYRDIPTRYETPWGLDYRIRLETVSVTDPIGSELQYEESWQGDDRRLKVWVPGARDTTRTVVLRYRVERALRFPEADADEGFAAHDELYWNATGTRWTVPIRSASARVILPAEVESPVEAAAYTGAYGSRASAATIARPAANQVLFRSEAQLGPGEGMSIVVGWPPGAVRRPTIADSARNLLRDNWPLGLPLLALGGMILAFRRYGRDPELDRSVMVEYSPPENLRPAQLGICASRRPRSRDGSAPRPRRISCACAMRMPSCCRTSATFSTACSRAATRFR